MIALETIRAGLLTTVQDLGRSGLGSIGVGISGALDRGSAAEANRLVGNTAAAALLEITLGQFVARAHQRVEVALAGAVAPAKVDGVAVGHRARVVLRAGQIIELGVPTEGVRTYLAIRGGIDIDSELGSRSTDTLSGLGPPAVADGDTLGVGREATGYPSVDFIPHRNDLPTDVIVRYTYGPRDDWFTPAALRLLNASEWRIGPDSNRIGIRLDGPNLERSRTGELPSEGVVVGSIQVPTSGPIIFMNDHPVTGGYPVVGVVIRGDLDRVAQARPGQAIRLVPLDPGQRLGTQQRR